MVIGENVLYSMSHVTQHNWGEAVRVAQ